MVNNKPLLQKKVIMCRLCVNGQETVCACALKQHTEDTNIREEIRCTRKHLSHEMRDLFEAPFAHFSKKVSREITFFNEPCLGLLGKKHVIKIDPLDS